MKNSPHVTAKLIAALAIITPASAVFGHVVLEDQAALAGRSYKAALKVGHGCAGSPTTAIQVTIPAGFTDAKPMPKAGWKLDIKTGYPFSSKVSIMTE